MAASFNKVILAGNLTRDPELRSLPSGNAVARLSIAVNRVYQDKDGNKREEATFIDVDAFGRQAETIAKYCTKGSGLLVEGRLKLDQWEDKNTREKRSKLGVILESFQFIGGGRRDNDSSQQGYDSVPASRPAPASQSYSQRAPEPPQADNSGVDEDVPF